MYQNLIKNLCFDLYLTDIVIFYVKKNISVIYRF